MKNLKEKNANYKVAKITLIEDYGGQRAWAIQESYDNGLSYPPSHTHLKGRYFDQIQIVIEQYLSMGFKVKIIK